jgi:hypothetical protein
LALFYCVHALCCKRPPPQNQIQKQKKTSTVAALTEGGAIQVDTVVLEDGEEHKTLGELNRVWTAALEARLDRGATFLALGGGVVGDMTGFAAACYQRGVHFVQVPTTVMSQVDSSVGGKTGVNHALGKNMVGAFYQPRCVLIDTDTLNTLPPRCALSVAGGGGGCVCVPPRCRKLKLSPNLQQLNKHPPPNQTKQKPNQNKNTASSRRACRRL